MLVIEPGDTILLAAQDLIVALRQKHSKALVNLDPRHTEALHRLLEIFETVTTVDAPEPRVEAPVRRVQEPSTSHDATALRALRETRPTHQSHTRNNTPVNLQDDDTNNENTVKASNVSKASKRTRKYTKQVAQRNEKWQQIKEENEAVETAIKEVEALPKPPPSPAKHPRRTVAQYRAKRQTADILNTIAPVPITQEDEDKHYANATTSTIPTMFSTTTPCGISQQAIYHLIWAKHWSKTQPQHLFLTNLHSNNPTMSPSNTTLMQWSTPSQKKQSRNMKNSRTIPSQKRYGQKLFAKN
ncbi:hypothetical protein ACHAXN_001248 [Cyclotella atomus]